MKKVLLFVLAAVLALVAYLTLAPVPIAPVAWEAPVDRGYVGAFAPNRDLAGLSRISLGDYHGPEDVVDTGAGTLAATTQDGLILLVEPDTGEVEVLADTGGVPLGIESEGPGGYLLVADAHKGLLAVGMDGRVEVLTDTVNGTPILYADDLDIAGDVVYFSDASTKFGAKANGSTMEASLLEIIEGAGTGRLLAYDMAARTTRVVLDGLVFPNGVAVHPDGDVLVNVTGRYQVLKVDPATGASEVWLDNLPGFPDNINRGPGGTFFIGLVSPRSDFLDDNAGNPFMRKLALRLPEFMQPAAQPYGVLLQVDADGEVIRTWHDPDGEYETPTGAVVAGDRLYITSLTSPELGYRDYP